MSGKGLVLRIQNGDYCVEGSSIGGAVQSYFRWDGKNREDVFYPKQINEKIGGNFPCVPFIARKPSPFTQLPSYGWLQDKHLRLMHKDGYSFSFRGLSKKGPSFPWTLQYDVTTSLISPTCLMTEIRVKRLLDGARELAPINLSFFPFFRSDGGIVARVGEVGEEDVYNESDFSTRPKEVPFNKRVVIGSKGNTRRVMMVIEGDVDSSSRFCLWKNSSGKYFCVKPKMTSNESFAHPSAGIFLAPGDEKILRCSFLPMG